MPSRLRVPAHLSSRWVALAEEIARIGAAAAALGDAGETLTGVVASEPSEGRRLYLCAYERSDGARSWLALDDAGIALEDRQILREAVTIAALCELAEETAAGGNAAELLRRLAELQAEDPSLELQRAEAAARELARATEEAPRLASPAYRDRGGAAAWELEQALGPSSGSPFALALQRGMAAVEALADDVERSYKRPLG
jgi:hypothetical protein